MFLLVVLGYADLQVDINRLQEDLIRIHVVANSDSEQDQSNKLLVRDAVLDYLQPKLSQFTDKEQVQQFLSQHLSELTEVVNRVLAELKTDQQATVKLQQEEFSKREYDTFALPSGCYDAIRIEIGQGEGENWWCVAFPMLCVPRNEEAFSETATQAGLDSRLSATLTRQTGYEIRFFLLDCVGKLGNFFQRG